MKLIVGLGNPGKDYENTRHNTGFIFIDNYAKKRGLVFKEKMNALYAEDYINREKVLIVKPQMYMNLSGVVLKKYVDFFKVSISDIFVIYDDMSFEIGKFKIKNTGSSGGHNGLNDIINALNTQSFLRMKIGISRPKYNMKDYVLGKFNDEEIKSLDLVLSMSESIISDFVLLPIDKLMSKYNK